jgi:hypothetical protein
MACTTIADCPTGQFCVAGNGVTACYQPTNPQDQPTLVAAGVIATDGAVLSDAAPDSTIVVATSDSGGDGTSSGGDASGDSTVSTGGDASDGGMGLVCDAHIPDGACNFCLPGVCANGTCANGANDFACTCFSGYSGTGTHSCTLTNACLANAACLTEYPCQLTASPGFACLGQFATWTMPDQTLNGGGQVIAKAAPHYSAGGGIVTDTVTALQWQQASISDCSGGDGGSPSCTYAQAQTYCQTLALGGNTDWRVPGKIEIESLLDCTVSAVPTINQAAFPSTPAGEFWSASTYVGSATQWTTDFYNCRTYSNHPLVETHLLRCVRGTGITTATPAQHYTINSGAINAGAADGGDAATEDTVTDNWTGLTWERDYSATGVNPAVGVTQTQAIARCTGLGFRLPTQKELLTLVDPTRLNPAIDPTAFPGTPSAFFYAYNSLVNFSSGFSQSEGGTNVENVRCVK